MLSRKVDRTLVKDFLLDLHTRLTTALQTLDGCAFSCDPWNRQDGGGGLTCVIQDGDLFERGAVSFSHVRGDRLPAAASGGRTELAGRRFEAMGVSLVLHPRNPYVPTAHFNIRFFLAHDDSSPEAPTLAPQADNAVWWFGGGMDLTPYYPFVDDVVHFHTQCRTALEPFGPEYYPRFKRWCDDYFFLKHRREPRGVGGIFFDDLRDKSFDHCLALWKSVATHFLPAYTPIVERRRQHEYGEREREFQLYRRGRYVEFNLIYDRGTLFGLQSDGRTESILVSLPPVVKWRYDWHPQPGTPEHELYSNFLIQRDWL